MLAYSAKRVASRWRSTSVIVVAIAIPLAVFGIVYPVNNIAFSELQNYSNYSFGYVVVSTNTYSNYPSNNTAYLTEQNLSSIRSIQGVEGVYGMTYIGAYIPLTGRLNQSYVQCEGKSYQRPPAGISQILGASILAVNTSVFSKSSLPYQIIEGRFPHQNETDAIAVNDITAKCLGLSIGDSYVIADSSPSGQSFNATLRVVGIYETPSVTGTDIGGGLTGEGIMSLEPAIRIFPFWQGRYTLAWVVLANLNDVARVGSVVQGMFPNFGVYYPSSQLEQTLSLLKDASSSYNLVTYLALFSGIAAVATVRLLDIQSKKKEFGLYLSQGWKRKDILRYEIELSIFYGLMGSLLAIILSGLLRNIVTGMVGFSNVVSAEGPGFFSLVQTMSVMVIAAMTISLIVSLAIYRKVIASTPGTLIRS